MGAVLSPSAWISVMKISNPASSGPPHYAEFGSLLDGVDGVAASVREPDNFAFDAFACSRNEEKSLPGNGWRTLPRTLVPHRGHVEQIFGADEQDPRRWAKQPRSVRRYAMQSGKGPNSNFDPLCQLAPALNGWGFLRRPARRPRPGCANRCD